MASKKGYNTVSADVQKQAEGLLDRLIEIDCSTVESYYDMGSLLAALKHGKLYECLGYTSISALAEAELTYSYSTALRYLNTYNHFRRLKYTRYEAYDLLGEFGFTHMADILPGMTTKIAKRAIKARINNIDKVQVNFQLSYKELERVHEVLKSFGARHVEGKWVDMSDSFMKLINEKAGRPKLKAVK